MEYAPAGIERNFHSSSIKGCSNCIAKIRDQVDQFSTANTTVLVYGETGTGKELVANELHCNSLRANNPFVPVNCGAFPNELIINELFGHERGAFTGAVAKQQGLVASANGGTLFLDEIDSLSSQAQVILLRYLQDQSYRPLGGSQEQTSDVRIIAATHCDLRNKVAQGQFREDLFYRLDVLRISIPPLRQRKNDILILARYFAEKFSRKLKRNQPHMTKAFEQWLESYHWPGNVRELENVIMRWMFGQLPTSFNPQVESRPEDLQAIEDFAQHRALKMDLKQAKAQVIDAFEKHYVASMLRLTQGNITQAARRAGKERRAFGKLAKKYNLI